MAATRTRADGVRRLESFRQIPSPVSIIALAGFVLLALVVPDRGGFAWDDAVLDALNALVPISSEDLHPDPVLTATVAAVSAGAGLLALWLVAKRRWRAGVFLVGSIAGAVALSSLTKVLVQRPSIEGGPNEYSFPSGTAAWAMATVAAFVLLAPSPRARSLLIGTGGAFVLAFSLVITWEEWHYASDVLAGWLLAVGWVLLLGGALLRGDPGQGRSVAAESGAAPWGRARPSKSTAGE
jgi:undecaprenyl-diphosphatase